MSVVGVGVGAGAPTPQPDGWPNGVMVSSDGLVVTAAGLKLDLGAGDLFLELDSRQRVPARVQSVVGGGRLTLLKAQGGSFIPWNLTASHVQPGGRVIVLGHGVLEAFVITSATVLSTILGQGERARVMVTRIYMEGVHGAPVFDENCLFVGLVEDSDESLGVTFLIPATAVRDALPESLQGPG